MYALHAFLIKSVQEFLWHFTGEMSHPGGLHYLLLWADTKKYSVLSYKSLVRRTLYNVESVKPFMKIRARGDSDLSHSGSYEEATVIKIGNMEDVTMAAKNFDDVFDIIDDDADEALLEHPSRNHLKRGDMTHEELQKDRDCVPTKTSNDSDFERVNTLDIVKKAQDSKAKRSRPKSPATDMGYMLQEILQRVKNTEKMVKEMQHAQMEQNKLPLNSSPFDVAKMAQSAQPKPPKIKQDRQHRNISGDLPATTAISQATGDTQKTLFYKDCDLMAIDGPVKYPALYGTRLMSTLFSTEEMAEGWVAPVQPKSGKFPLDADRMTLIRQAMNSKYGEAYIDKHWSGPTGIRNSLNQKCLDQKKKLVKRIKV